MARQATFGPSGLSLLPPVAQGPFPQLKPMQSLGQRVHPWFLPLFVLVSAAMLLPLWVSEYLPMVDLPHHAAQLSISQHWEDPSLGYPQIYRFNWLAGQQVTYLFLSALAAFLPLSIALKVTLSLFLLALPYTCLALLKELRLNRWLCFPAFPTAFGYSFYWGFIDFLGAIPLVVLQVLVTHRYCRSSGRLGGLRLNLLAHLLFFTHPIAFGYAGLVSASIIGFQSLPWRDRLRQQLPLLLALPLPLLWLSLRLGPGETRVIWQLSPLRILELFGLIVGVPNEAGFAWGLLTLSCPFLLGYRFNKSWSRLGPLFVTCVVFFLFPRVLFWASYLYPRFPVFIFPALLYALDAESLEDTTRRWVRFLFPCFALSWLIFLTVQFHRFDLEARAFDRLLESMQPGKKVLSLIFEPRSAAAPAPVYLQFASWYQCKKGGTVDYVSGVFSRYDRIENPDFPPGFEAHPEWFRWSTESDDYDYFIIRGSRENWGAVLPADEVSLLQHTGAWWLFAKREPSDQGEADEPSRPATEN